MIFLNIHLTDPPPVHPTGLIQKLPEADGYLASQEVFAIFRDPYQMILKPMLRVGPVAYLAITRLCLIASTSPALLVSFRGPFIPGLESLGFSDNYIKKSLKPNDYSCF